MPSAVTIKGLPELTRKLERLQDLKQIIPELKASAVHLEGTVKVYPDETEANVEKYGSWYERGFGTKYKRRDGTVKGYKTSETLGRKWTIGKRNRGFTWIVGNNVSYGPYVQDRDDQAKVHKKNRWKTIQDVAEQEAETVLKFIKAKVDRILAG